MNVCRGPANWARPELAGHPPSSNVIHYRTSLTVPELLEPDAVYELRLDLWAMANVFLPGHRIRLEVASSNFPRFACNSNTGGEIAW
jgi:predicted acyl esterase